MRTECEYKVLSTDLSNRLFQQRTPLSGGIELINKCNFRCVHCYETLERDCEIPLFPTEELIKVIDKLIEMGVISVFLTGGEAMLRKDFDYIYQYLRKKGVLTAILTNGSTITEEKCRLFQQYMPRMIDITLYGASEETYEKVTGQKNMFQKVINNLDLLKKYGIPFQLKTVLLSINKHDLSAMKEIANKYFAMGYNRCKKHITIDVLNKNFPKSVDKQNDFLMKTYFPHMSFESTYEIDFGDKLLDPEILRTYAGVMNEKVPESKYFERKEK